jgi:hypothetical protein
LACFAQRIQTSSTDSVEGIGGASCVAGYAAMWAARKQQLVVLEAGRLRDAFGAFTSFF